MAKLDNSKLKSIVSDSLHSMCLPQPPSSEATKIYNEVIDTTVANLSSKNDLPDQDCVELRMKINNEILRVYDKVIKH